MLTTRQLRDLHELTAAPTSGIVKQMVEHLQQHYQVKGKRRHQNFPDKWVRDIKSPLWKDFFDQPLKKLGTGIWSTAYRYEDKVLQFSEEDPKKCWRRFIRYSQKNPSPHVPKFYEYETMGRYSFTLMELLQRLSQKQLVKMADPVLRGALEYVYWWEDKGKYKRAQTDDKGLLRYLRKHHEKSPILTVMYELIAKNPNCRLDLAPDNFIRRGKTIVLLDPLTTKPDW